MIHAIALSLIKNLSCRQLRSLCAAVGSPEEIFHLSSKELTSLLGWHTDIVNAIAKRTTMARAEEELRFCEKHHVRPLFFTDEAYPKRLNLPQAEDTPPLIYTMGQANLNAKHIVAVVGTRRISPYGEDLVRQLMEGLKGEDILIVSGLAYGVDTAAHSQALANGLPTVGVVAHGFDQLYPPKNRDLACRMVQTQGGMVTEYPSSTRILPIYFPARNRIVAALSDAVVVVESAKKGGSLITADLACGYNRDVFAFPGRVGDTNAEGTNKLIFSNKAGLIQSADDLLYSLNWDRESIPSEGKQQSLFADLLPDEERVLHILHQHESLLLDDIIEYAQIPLAQVATILLNLEFKSLCQSLPGRRYRALR